MTNKEEYEVEEMTDNELQEFYLRFISFYKGQIKKLKEEIRKLSKKTNKKEG